MYPTLSPSTVHHITTDAKEVTDAHLVLAVQYLVCIMDILHLLARYYGTGELHEHEYLRLVAR